MNKCLAVIFSLILIHGIAFADTLEGRWSILDDHTGKRVLTVMLESVNNKISARIIQVVVGPNNPDLCKLCSGDLRNKPLQGMRLLWNVSEQKHGIWGGGHMLDFKTGKVYRVRLKEVNKKLYVRQYVGTPFLGHTHIWVR